MLLRKAITVAALFASTTAYAQSGRNAEWAATARNEQPEEIEGLTNEDIIQLLANGISETMILTQIRTSHASYDTTTDGLIDLKTAEVPESIVNAMIARQRAIARRAPPAAGTARANAEMKELSADSPNPLVPHFPGIYMINAMGYSGKMRPVLPVDAEIEGGGNFLMQVASAGLLGGPPGRAKIKGASAQIQTTHRSPVFYAYFDESVPEHLRSNAPTIWGAGAGATMSTPQEFQLVQMKVKKKLREARLGNKIKGKHEIQFTTELLRPGIYRITVRSHLAPGEYGFVQSLHANDNKGRRAGRVFDFEVR